MTSEQTQAQVIRQLLSGTQEEIKKGIELLYREEQPKIRRKLSNFCSPSELEEIFTDALLELLKKVSIIKSSPIAYLHRICYYKACDLYRLNKKDIVLPMTEEDLSQLKDNFLTLEELHFEMDGAKAFSQAVTILMNELGEADREVLTQRYFQDWSNQEIAEEQGIKNQSAANKLSRSIQKLRRILEEKPKLKAIIEAQLYEEI